MCKVATRKAQAICVLSLLLCVWSGSFAQENGKNKKDTTKNFLEESKITQEIVESITRDAEDSLFTLKSEELFKPYEGRIIRRISVEHIGFDRSFYNGKKKVKNTIIKIGNALHHDTEEQIIRNNLFIKENRPLNPYKVADNERYLRDLEFILDASIRVKPVKGTDSVDLVVTTRDVFSLGGNVIPRSATRYTFKIYDANLFGWGQRLQVNGVLDEDRYPLVGSEVLYNKNSIWGSLANLSMGYTTLNTGSSYGDESEGAYFLKIDRPLVSPYTRIAGGLELSHNWSSNPYLKPDSLFLRYTYNVYDVWTGYNIGVNNNIKNRSRHFVGLRWFHQDFRFRPFQETARENAQYNDNFFLLGQFTFFKQDFYKTRYIYGFGRTEDVPYGHTAYISAGWSKFLTLTRPYLDGGINKKVVTERGDFYEIDVRAATFLRDNRAEDITGLFSLSWFSSLKTWKDYKIRQYVRGSYTALIRRSTNQLLHLNNELGVRGFQTDSLRGLARLNFTAETVVFTRWKLLGFNFAPMVYADAAFLSKENNIFYDRPYWGLGAGMRTRNENLIFGTIELKVTFYPRIREELTHFRISLLSNLRVKYTGSFVRPPSFVSPNRPY